MGARNGDRRSVAGRVIAPESAVANGVVQCSCSDVGRKGSDTVCRWTATWDGFIATLLLAGQAVLLWWAARSDSPTELELLYFSNGLHCWYTGSNEQFHQNPPLGKLLVAAAGAWQGVAREAMLANEEARFSLVPRQVLARAIGQDPETQGRATIEAIFRARVLLAMAAVVAGALLYAWLRRRVGALPALAACALWTFSPVLLTAMHLAAADGWATVIALLSVLAMGSYLERPTWANALCVGALLGAGLAIKFTLLVLIPVWVCIQAVCWLQKRAAALGLAAHTLAVLPLCWFLLALAYRFEGVGQAPPIEEFRAATTWGYIGSRNAAGPSLGWRVISRLLPNHFLLGLDTQAYNFEMIPDWSRVWGRWYQVGPIHYYVSHLLMKDAVGFAAVWIATLIAAMLLCVRGPFLPANAIAWLPAALAGGALLLVVSVEGRYVDLRYAFPALGAVLPVFGWWVARGGRKIAAAAIVLLAFGLAEAAPHWPRFVGFCSAIVGGPGDPWQMADPKVTARGQDYFRLRRWLTQHSEQHGVTHLHLWCHYPQATLPATICTLGLSEGPTVATVRSEYTPLFPGWHAVDRRVLERLAWEQQLAAQAQPLAVPKGAGDFARLVPRYAVGDSLFVYRVDMQDLSKLSAEPLGQSP